MAKAGIALQDPPQKRQDAPRRRQDVSPGPALHTRTCQLAACGRKFVTRRPDQKFCSKSHRSRAHEERKFLQPMAELKAVLARLLVRCEEVQRSSFGSAALRCDVLAARALLKKLRGEDGSQAKS